uniref:DUF4806 domain-containing protein n=1 Tax=Strongyloides papillosus TaxID=174720 RepID=A0A0N5C2K3_STREA
MDYLLNLDTAEPTNILEGQETVDINDLFLDESKAVDINKNMDVKTLMGQVMLTHDNWKAVTTKHRVVKGNFFKAPILPEEFYRRLSKTAQFTDSALYRATTHILQALGCCTHLVKKSIGILALDHLKSAYD